MSEYEAMMERALGRVQGARRDRSIADAELGQLCDTVGDPRVDHIWATLDILSVLDAAATALVRLRRATEALHAAALDAAPASPPEPASSEPAMPGPVADAWQTLVARGHPGEASNLAAWWAEQAAQRGPADLGTPLDQLVDIGNVMTEFGIGSPLSSRPLALKLREWLAQRGPADAATVELLRAAADWLDVTHRGGHEGIKVPCDDCARDLDCANDLRDLADRMEARDG